MEPAKTQKNMGKIAKNSVGVWRFAAALSLSFVTTCAIAKDVKPWPVTLAQDGFSIAEVAQVKKEFEPLKLAAGGNQALYTYLNMTEFFPHQLVARSGQIKALPSVPNPALGEVRARTSLGNLTLTEMLKDPRSRVQGFLVVHKGKIVFEQYPGMHAEDSHLWWSVAKVLAGVLTEQLIHEGKVDEQKNIVAYLPEFKGSGWDDASVGNVLHMASGITALDSAESYADPQSEMGRLIYAERILAAPGYQPVTHNQALQMMTSARKPGTKYEYSSANTNMLGLLIERVTGKRYSDAVQERIWSKMGAEGDGLMGLTPQGNAIAHGMFSSRLRDLARFGMLLTPSGSKPAVIPESVLKKIDDPGNNKHYRNSPEVARAKAKLVGDTPVNALSQWDAVFADGDLYKSGYDGQALYVSPSKDIVIVMYSTSKCESAYKYLRAIASNIAR